MAKKEKIRTCATCSIAVRTRSGVDGEEWYCKDHRVCVSPSCNNITHILNSMCRDCHIRMKPAAAYGKQRVVRKKCDFCGADNNWGEHYYLTHRNNLVCQACRKYVSREIESHQKSVRAKNIRYCTWCSGRLSAYNSGKVCNACWKGASMKTRSSGKWASESRIPV